jgi:hypothetical protein
VYGDMQQWGVTLGSLMVTLVMLDRLAWHR